MIRNSISIPARILGLAVTVALAGLGAPAPAAAQNQSAVAGKKTTPDKKDSKAKTPDKKDASKKDAAAKPGGKPAETDKPSTDKPSKVATSGDWGAYTSGTGKNRTCYALSEPRDRQPATLKRDKGYLFISNRPGESVRNEVAFDVGFDVKTDSPATAEIGAASFDLVAKGSKLWVKNAADEPQFVEALRKGQKLLVKASSKKGNASTDAYALAGVAQILDRAAKDCQ